jgi:hypothetical protein
VRLYGRILEWVDRQWRAPGLQFKILELPSVLPFLFIIMVDGGPGPWAIGWAWFASWNAFVFWRGWQYLTTLSEDEHQQFDRVGKFRPASECHETESATVAAKRERGG